MLRAAPLRLPSALERFVRGAASHARASSVYAARMGAFAWPRAGGLTSYLSRATGLSLSGLADPPPAHAVAAAAAISAIDSLRATGAAVSATQYSRACVHATLAGQLGMARELVHRACDGSAGAMMRRSPPGGGGHGVGGSRARAGWSSGGAAMRDADDGVSSRGGRLQLYACIAAARVTAALRDAPSTSTATSLRGATVPAGVAEEVRQLMEEARAQALLGTWLPTDHDDVLATPLPPPKLPLSASPVRTSVSASVSQAAASATAAAAAVSDAARALYAAAMLAAAASSLPFVRQGVLEVQAQARLEGTACSPASVNAAAALIYAIRDGGGASSGSSAVAHTLLLRAATLDGTPLLPRAVSAGLGRCREQHEPGTAVQLLNAFIGGSSELHRLVIHADQHQHQQKPKLQLQPQLQLPQQPPEFSTATSSFCAQAACALEGLAERSLAAALAPRARALFGAAIASCSTLQGGNAALALLNRYADLTQHFAATGSGLFSAPADASIYAPAIVALRRSGARGERLAAKLLEQCRHSYDSAIVAATADLVQLRGTGSAALGSQARPPAQARHRLVAGAAVVGKDALRTLLDLTPPEAVFRAALFVSAAPVPALPPFPALGSSASPGQPGAGAPTGVSAALHNLESMLALRSRLKPVVLAAVAAAASRGANPPGRPQVRGGSLSSMTVGGGSGIPAGVSRVGGTPAADARAALEAAHAFCLIARSEPGLHLHVAVVSAAAAPPGGAHPLGTHTQLARLMAVAVEAYGPSVFVDAVDTAIREEAVHFPRASVELSGLMPPSPTAGRAARSSPQLAQLREAAYAAAVSVAQRDRDPALAEALFQSLCVGGKPLRESGRAASLVPGRLGSPAHQQSTHAAALSRPSTSTTPPTVERSDWAQQACKLIRHAAARPDFSSPAGVHLCRTAIRALHKGGEFERAEQVVCPTRMRATIQ